MIVIVSLRFVQAAANVQLEINEAFNFKGTCGLGQQLREYVAVITQVNMWHILFAV